MVIVIVVVEISGQRACDFMEWSSGLYIPTLPCLVAIGIEEADI